MGLKAVLFDMDGVIVDSEPEYFRIEMELFKRFNVGFNEQDQGRFVGINPLIMWQEIKDKYELTQTVKELYDIEADMMREYYAVGELKVIDPIQQLIQEIFDHGFLCAVASSSDKENIYQVLKRLALSDFFKAVVSNNDVERCKPLPDIYLLAAKRLRVQPSECIVIEDSNAGVTAAQAAGMKVIQYCAHIDCNLSDADWAVSHMNEVTLPRIKALMQ